MCLNLYLPRIEEHYKYAEIMPKHNISPSTRFFPHKERYEIFDGKIFARKSCRKIKDFCTRFCSHKNRPYTLSLFVFLYLTYGRWASTCLVANSNNCNVTTLPVVTEDIFPSLPGSRLRHLIAMQVQALLHLVNQWSYFTCSRSRETLSSSTEARIKLMVEEASPTYISSTYPYKMRKYYFRLPT